jgi:hypothetical protein
MAKKKAQLRVVFTDGNRATRVFSAVLAGFDLYTINHTSPLEGKHSYHESGVSHKYLDVIDKRIGEGEPPGVSLKDIRGLFFVTAFGAGSAPPLDEYLIKPDTKRMRTLVLPPPPHPWGVDVWAIEPGKEGRLIPRILGTRPWPSAPIVGAVASEWSTPVILLTVWQATTAEPYTVIRYDPPLSSRVPYLILPKKWEGTWLEKLRGQTQSRERTG